MKVSTFAVPLGAGLGVLIAWFLAPTTSGILAGTLIGGMLGGFAGLRIAEQRSRK